ncbi:beta-mannosidase [Apiospora kogelbergensis]|uniref:Beta-mannosidase A n=1 Tax=Apiospora kogelbergensis TaxID=1337665 RepID=A0AAW0Q7Q3_9PEZI
MAFLAPFLLGSSVTSNASSPGIFDLSASQWTLSNPALDINIPASFPSYAHLDLYANQVIGNPEYGLNDFNLRWIWKQNWTYTTTLASLSTRYDQTFLLFQGLDTFTTIELCGQHVSYTNNQFRQYYFNVTDVLAHCQRPLTLSLNFGSAPQIAENIANQPGQTDWPTAVKGLFEIPHREFMRKEQNDFGWDWGPAFAPAGPWQPGFVVQLNREQQVHPRNVLVDIYRQGQRNNLIPDQGQPWVLNASIDYIGEHINDPSLHFVLRDAMNQTVVDGALVNITSVPGTITGSNTLPSDSVDLWWPVGMGPQTLYWLTVGVRDTKNNTIASVTRRVGFRTIVLNGLPVLDGEIATGVAPGNHWHFEINGHAFFAKGSNFIPPDVFWPRVTPQRIRSLFDAVVAGNQNMLRVWSSGAYSPDFMFEVADEMGILLWSEFEFGDTLYPVDEDFLENVYEEAVYQVRRVNHHPSLAYWAGGNELENLELPTAKKAAPGDYPRILAEYEKLFLSTLFPAVFENSRSISYAPSSTSNGFITLNFTDAPYMQQRYNNLEPGHIYGETDYYHYDSSVAFNNSAYPVGRFSNEFGYHSMPSLQTWQEYALPPGGLNTTNYRNTSKGMAEMTAAAQRWYPRPEKSNSMANFSAWCWTTQVFQADYYGAQIQFYRRGSGLPQRTLGSLYWQLEDQWAAPTWAGIDRAGRWKILHYRAKDLYSNVIISPFWNATTRELDLWVTSDLWSEVRGTVNAKWYTWDGEEVDLGGSNLRGQEVTVGPLNTTKVLSTMLNANASDLVMKAEVEVTGKMPNSDDTALFQHTNWFHTAPLSQAKLVDPGLQLTHSDTSRVFTIAATSGISAWTWLDTPAGAVVVFDDNGFWLGKGETKKLIYRVIQDDTDGEWVKNVTIQSLWNSTLAD